MISKAKFLSFLVGLVSIVLLVSLFSVGIGHPVGAAEKNTHPSESEEEIKQDMPAPPEDLEVHHYDFLGEMGDKDFEVWETEMNGEDLFIYYPTEDPEDGYPALALGHGFTHNPDFFVSWGEYYASRGFVIAIPDLGFFYNDGWPDDLLSTLELMKEEDEKEGSPLEGKIAEDKMGLTGFSAGGQAAILAAEQDALEERGLVQAIAPMAPSIYTDDGDPTSLNVDIEDLEVPIQLQAGTEDGIVPAEDVEEFYEDLEASDKPSQFYLKDGANHNQYGDDDSFGGIGDGDPEISREEQQRLARKYMISFFNYYLRGEEKYGEYPFGTFIELEVKEGNLVSNEYRNVDYTTSSGIIGFDHNKIVWGPSADDPDNVDHYNIYRSEKQDGPWDEPIEQVVANGSAIYSFVDEEKGDADDIHWWYLVRAVSEEEGEEENDEAVQEPGEEPGLIPPADPDPGDGDTGIDLEVELSVLVEHEDDEDMDVSFYDASDESSIETETDVPSGERASVIWEDLEPDNTYQWYAEADDGEETATSPTWEFTTMEVPDGHELTINIVGEGSTDPEEGAHVYEEGEEVTVEATPAEGWTFDEWTGDETGTEPTIEIIMDADKSITAVFQEETPEEYELTIDIQGEGSTEPEEGTHNYEEGESVTITAAPADGWLFDQWSGDVTGNDPTIEITMDDDKSITAVFQEETIEYELSIDVEGQGSTEPEEGTHTYEEGESITITAAPADGWLFDHWTGDVTGTDPTTQITMDEDKSVTAVFEEEIVEYELTIDVEGEGSTDPEEGTYTYEEGEEVTVEAIPEVGWYFDGWTGDHESTEEELSIMMEEDVDITAHFSIQEYDLTIEVEGEGTTEPSEGTHTYEFGEEVDITASPAEGWKFEEWTGDTTSYEETLTIEMDEDKEMTANFIGMPHFEVEITDHDQEISEDEVITIEYRVENTGEGEGTQDIVLHFNSEKVAIESALSLGPGEEYIGEFTLTEEPGEYQFEISSSDTSESFDVKVQEMEDDDGFVSDYWWLIVVLLIGVIAAVVLMFVLTSEEKEDEQQQDPYHEYQDNTKEQQGRSPPQSKRSPPKPSEERKN